MPQFGVFVLVVVLHLCVITQKMRQSAKNVLRAIPVKKGIIGGRVTATFLVNGYKLRTK